MAGTVERVCQSVAGAMEAMRGGMNTIMGNKEKKKKARAELNLTKRPSKEWVIQTLPITENALRQ